MGPFVALLAKGVRLDGRRASVTGILRGGPAAETSRKRMILVEIEASRRRPRDSTEILTLVLCFALAAAAYFGIGLPRLLEIWGLGPYFDTDDAMRMVQVRDLLAGQSWYDMTAWQLDPPHGMFSHWSRVVDAPVAGLVLFFRLFLDDVFAERAARIAFPALMTAGLFVAGLHAARVFAKESMRLFGIAAMLFCGVLFWQFPAGRNRSPRAANRHAADGGRGDGVLLRRKTDARPRRAGRRHDRAQPLHRARKPAVPGCRRRRAHDAVSPARF